MDITKCMGTYMKKTKKKKKYAVFRYIRKNLTVILLIIMTLITVGTFAWFSVSNNPKVQNLALVADHAGNLQIADDEGGKPGTYGDALDLSTAMNAEYMKNVRLSPVTTKDGVTFFAPEYDAASNAVNNVVEIKDHDKLIHSYIYEKTFYLKASSGDGTTTTGSTYEIALVGQGTSGNGSYILKSTTGEEDADATTDTAAYAVRISFTVNGETFVYEPNYNKNNTGTEKAKDGMASKGYGTFTKLFRQGVDGKFEGSDGGNSQVLFSIPENTDTLVTMRVWLEGTDVDCGNSVGADMIQGQIQFISNEVAANQTVNNE